MFTGAILASGAVRSTESTLTTYGVPMLYVLTGEKEKGSPATNRGTKV